MKSLIRPYITDLHLFVKKKPVGVSGLFRSTLKAGGPSPFERFLQKTFGKSQKGLGHVVNPGMSLISFTCAITQLISQETPEALPFDL